MHTRWFQIVTWSILYNSIYLFMASFSIHLLILKKWNLLRCEQKFCHFFYVIYPIFTLFYDLKSKVDNKGLCQQIRP